MAAARLAAEKVAVETSLLGGDPRQKLIEISGEADLLVVGDSGMGSLRGILIGSVALGVAGHADRDVVVVRASATAPRAEVVVGVDGSAAQSAVLDFAFREAAARAAVSACRPRLELARRRRHRRGRRRTGGQQAGPGGGPGRSADLFPDVRVSVEVVEGTPGRRPAHAADQAELLVVGSRGHGALAGMVLGSVSQALLHVAPCPVAVVRPRR